MADDDDDRQLRLAAVLHARAAAEATASLASTRAWRDVARWRKAERERLIAARLAVSADERAPK